MKTFRTENIYLILHFAILLGCLVLISQVNQKGFGTLHLLLTSLASGIALLSLVYSFFTVIRVNEDFVEKRNLTGKKSIRYKDVEEVAAIPLKGRYIFMLISQESFLVLTSITKDFIAMRREIAGHLPAKAAEDIMKIEDVALLKKAFLMKFILFIILLLVVAINIYVGR